MIDHDLLSMLPVPTVEQTTQFAAHVADNHSWYKHLPFFPPGAAFVFFPNPHAGRGVKDEGGRVMVYDIEQGDYFAHHSRMSTANYRARFGHWDYWVDDNPRHCERVPGPWLLSVDGTHRELLPDILKSQWSCRLTAFLRPMPTMFQLCKSELSREADAFVGSVRKSIWHRFLGRLSAQPDPVVARYRAVAAKLRGADSIWGNPELNAFMESESQAQLKLIVDTLQRIRDVWISAENPQP